MMGAIGAPVEKIYYCPHVPEADCFCRKPNIGLLVRAASEMHFDPSDAVVIGDNYSDVELGHRVGAKTVLISQEGVDPNEDCRPHFVVGDLLAARRAMHGATIDCSSLSTKESA
jgi:D-glycero-D-manno-heptose 1,7-bisphosphate phosphatase